MCIRDRDIARGFVVWLSDRSGKKPEDLTVAVGRDPRISGKRLVQGMMNGFGPYGVKVYDCGLASTPAMFMTTVFPEFACDAGIMVTASHLPYNRNGFKFFTAEGGLNKGDIAQILEYAVDEEACRAKLGEPGNHDARVRDFGKLVYPMVEGDVMTVYCCLLYTSRCV